MALADRKRILSELEQEFDARVVTLVTGDRPGMQTQIAGDLLPLMSSLLSKRPEGKRIALFLYTAGGETIAGWGLVNLLRQYADVLTVVVPFKALSTGTLIALGADELYLGKHGLLSPVDPSVNSPYNPLAPQGTGAPGALLPVSVEDVTGFLDLARQELGIKNGKGSDEILRILADKVHPLALGAVYRAREHSSSQAKRLLQMHMRDDKKIDSIVNKLTKELPTHSYLIGRIEASEIGIRTDTLSTELEESTWNLYTEYETWLKLTEPYSSLLAIGDQPNMNVHHERAALEMLNGGVLEQYKFISDRRLLKIQVPVAQTGATTDQIAEQIVYEGWWHCTDQEDANA